MVRFDFVRDHIPIARRCAPLVTWHLTTHKSLSLYARKAAAAYGYDSVERKQYRNFWAGMETTTAQQRCAATTRLTHDEAMRQELDTFIEWVKDNMYVTAEEAKARPELEQVW